MLNSENFNKVSPYSIKNLSSYTLKVISSKRLNNLDMFDEAPHVSVTDNNLISFLESTNRETYQQLRLSAVLQNETIEVLPNMTVDYSVDLDKESNNFLTQSSKRPVTAHRTIRPDNRGRASTIASG